MITEFTSVRSSMARTTSFLNNARGRRTWTMHGAARMQAWLLTVTNSQFHYLTLRLGFVGKLQHDPGMPKRGRTYVNQSVSFPPELLAAARRRARNLGLAFSAYIQKCLQRDLTERGSIVFSESEGAVQMAAESPQPAHEHTRPRSPRK
jgi:hypothetical protein